MTEVETNKMAATETECEKTINNSDASQKPVSYHQTIKLPTTIAPPPLLTWFQSCR